MYLEIQLLSEANLCLTVLPVPDLGDTALEGAPPEPTRVELGDDVGWKTQVRHV